MAGQKNRAGAVQKTRLRYIKGTDKLVHRVCMPGGKHKRWVDENGTRIADDDTELR